LSGWLEIERLQNESNGLARLKSWARGFEAQVAEWPLWRKSLVLIPIVVLLLWLLAMGIYVIGMGLSGVERSLISH
jgi:hypothetical protein